MTLSAACFRLRRHAAESQLCGEQRTAGHRNRPGRAGSEISCRHDSAGSGEEYTPDRGVKRNFAGSDWGVLFRPGKSGSGGIWADGFERLSVVLAAAVVTMALAPFLIGLGPRIVDYLSKVLPNQNNFDEVPTDKIDHCHDHVIIAGYGLNGHNVARVLKDLDLPYVIVEMNPITVRAEKEKGEPVVLGDCSRAPLLEHLGAKEARAMVIVISDPNVTRHTVRVARQVNPQLHIIVRTRYVSEVDELRQLGESEIIPEEFETSVEIFARVLQRFLIPRNLILDLVQRIRHDHYEVLRDDQQGANKMELPVGMLQDVNTITCLIRDHSPAIGKTIKELDFRGRDRCDDHRRPAGRKIDREPSGGFSFGRKGYRYLGGKWRPARSGRLCTRSQRL